MENFGIAVPLRCDEIQLALKAAVRLHYREEFGVNFKSNVIQTANTLLKVYGTQENICLYDAFDYHATKLLDERTLRVDIQKIVEHEEAETEVVTIASAIVGPLKTRKDYLMESKFWEVGIPIMLYGPSGAPVR